MTDNPSEREQGYSEGYRDAREEIRLEHRSFKEEQDRIYNAAANADLFGILFVIGISIGALAYQSCQPPVPSHQPAQQTTGIQRLVEFCDQYRGGTKRKIEDGQNSFVECADGTKMGFRRDYCKDECEKDSGPTYRPRMLPFFF